MISDQIASDGVRPDQIVSEQIVSDNSKWYQVRWRIIFVQIVLDLMQSDLIHLMQSDPIEYDLI
jgi:hypothetical protein